MTSTCRFYRVIDEDGSAVFRGPVREIAKRYGVTKTYVYYVASGRDKRLCRRYTLEYDGRERPAE